MACVKCNQSVVSGEIHHIAADLGLELLFIIEQDMACEVRIFYFQMNSYL